MTTNWTPEMLILCTLCRKPAPYLMSGLCPTCRTPKDIWGDAR